MRDRAAEMEPSPRREFAKIGPALPNDRWRGPTQVKASPLEPTATDGSRRAIGTAVATQLACAAYLQFIEWVPVFPWNDLSHGNAQEVLDIVLALLQIGIAAAYLRHWRWAMATGLAGYIAWFLLQLDSWWRPYLLGGRIAGPNWYFARTYKFLPQIDRRPTPDAAHVALQILLLLVIIAGVRAWRAIRTAPGSSTKNSV